MPRDKAKRAAYMKQYRLDGRDNTLLRREERKEDFLKVRREWRHENSERINRRYSEQTRERRAKWHKEGKCPYCGVYCWPRYYCRKHADYENVRRVGIRAKWKEEGKCSRCRLKLHPEMDKGYLTCTFCRGRYSI